METSQGFLTGSTGLLGNNLVRQLLHSGFTVRALARSRAIAERQFAGVPRGAAAGQLEIVEGDLANVATFASALRDVGVFFQTKSQRELGIKFRAVSETLRDTADWFRTQGMIAARPNRADHTLPVLELS